MLALLLDVDQLVTFITTTGRVRGRIESIVGDTWISVEDEVAPGTEPRHSIVNAQHVVTIECGLGWADGSDRLGWAGGSDLFGEGVRSDAHY